MCETLTREMQLSASAYLTVSTKFSMKNSQENCKLDKQLARIGFVNMFLGAEKAETFYERDIVVLGGDCA